MTTYKTRVYYSDTDASSIVYHTRYLDWAEHARTEMLREALPGFSQEEAKNRGFFFVVKSINIEYFKAAHLDDEILVETEVSELGVFYGVITQRILDLSSRVLHAELKVKVGFIDNSTFKPTKLPEDVVKALRNI